MLKFNVLYYNHTKWVLTNLIIECFLKYWTSLALRLPITKLSLKGQTYLPTVYEATRNQSNEPMKWQISVDPKIRIQKSH